MLAIDVAGALVNQPPTADAGRDQTVECAEPAVLDGRGSSDLDGNLALFSWRRGGRSGPEVGFDARASVQQGLGRESYLLRVIDTFAQSDEDTTMVNVVDTMPPLVSCSLGMPVIGGTNHSMVNVGLSADARDACEGPLPVRVSVFADEGGGAVVGQPDAIQGGRAVLRLRAERDRGGDGRVYLIVVDAADTSGNRGVGCCTAVVPYAKGAEALRAVQTQAAAAQRHCMESGGSAPAGYLAVGERASARRNP